MNILILYHALAKKKKEEENRKKKQHKNVKARIHYGMIT